MENDIIDGVRWLVESGVADPRKICLYGAEFGGYANAQGLVHMPELFACGAALDGIFDLDSFLEPGGLPRHPRAQSSDR